MTKDQGWHKDSKQHAEAAKGIKTKDTDKAQGWHGDSKGHAKAAKSEKNKGSILDKLTGKD